MISSKVKPPPRKTYIDSIIRICGAETVNFLLPCSILLQCASFSRCRQTQTDCLTFSGMKAARQMPVLLEEAGITMTNTQFAAPGHVVEFRKITFLRIERVTSAIDRLTCRAPKFRLMLATHPDSAPASIFEPRD